MAFSDNAIKAASKAAVFGIQRHLGAFSLFAHNFTSEAGEKFSGVSVPVYDLNAAADFAEGTNDWCNGSDDVDGKVVTLDKHFIKTIALPDTGIGVSDGAYAGAGAGETDISFIENGSMAIADVLGTAAAKYVWGLFTSTNVTLSATLPTSVTDLVAVCDEKGVDPFDSVLVLNPTEYGKLLAELPANVYGGMEAVRDGMVQNVYGFKGVVMTGYLPSGVKGLIVPRGSLGVVSRLNKPAINGYTDTWQAEDANGLTIGFRVFENLCAGKAQLGGDLLIGAKIINKAIRLV